MSKDKAGTGLQEVKQPVIKIRPVLVEFSVVAEVQQDGKLADHVTWKDKVTEINFNHGLTVENIVMQAKKAMEDKYLPSK